jgi:asparagine synthase (glutamine-hydrolysing)
MCGIVAALGRVDAGIVEALRRMNASLAHRGPDDEGFWSGEGVALAQRRLAIIDLSPGGHQPMVDAETGAVLVYNGEVYNFAELRRELEARGDRFESQSDTEVVLKGWRAWGEACVERFRGMFTILLWDPGRRVLFVARDRLGIKPLYYARVGGPGGQGTLLFASELRGLLASGLLAPRLAPRAVAGYVWNGFVNGPEAIVEGARCLRPGHRAVVTPDALAVDEQPYWELPRGGEGETDTRLLAERLAEAVRLRLVSDVPLGVFLSGGVDSSAVAALAVRGATSQVRTFNIGFEEEAYDETRYATAVAAALGTEHTTIPVTRGMFRESLDAALGSIDQPTFDQLNTYLVSRAVREAGLTVALSGLGGDELFGGYRSFRDLPAASRWARALSPVAGPVGGAARALASRVAGPGAVGSQVRWAKLADLLATDGRLVDAYQVSYALYTEDFYERLLEPGVARGSELGLAPERRRELAARIAGVPPLHAVSLLELSSFVSERLLRDSDAASMAVSLELRVPLLDHLVVEALARLDEAVRFQPLGRKGLLRELALERVDASIFERSKAGFVLPIELWVREALRDEVEGTLRDADLCRAAGLRPEAVVALWRGFQAGARGLYWSRVWALYVLLWWCRRYGARIA